LKEIEEIEERKEIEEEKLTGMLMAWLSDRTND